jgi:hypothetical protein
MHLTVYKLRRWICLHSCHVHYLCSRGVLGLAVNNDDNDNNLRLVERNFTDLGGSFGIIEDLNSFDLRKLDKMCQRLKSMPVS